MKSLRRIACVATAFAVLIGISACGTPATNSSTSDAAPNNGLPATIRVGAAAGPPFLFRDPSGAWTSFSAELAKKFGEYAHAKIEFVDTTFPTMIAGLQTSKYDVVQPINATPERREVVDFTEGVSAAGALYFVQPGSGLKTIDDLNKPSVTIAVISGSAEEQTTKKLLPNATLRSLPTASVADLATEVSSGHSNVMADSSYLAPAIKTAFDLDAIPSFESTPDGLEPVQIGFAVKKSDTALLKELNAFIAEVKANGELKKLADKWLTVDNALKG